MININTLNELNRIGIGANISKLESYVVDYRQASNMTNLYRYEYDYRKLSKMLKEIKPESFAFGEKAYLEELEFDQFDQLLVDYPNETLKEIYGSCDENVDNIFTYITSKPENCMDMVAIPDILGLSVRCIYLSGYIHKINLIGENCKYTDITERFQHLLPRYVEKFKDNKITELRGKITIFKGQLTPDEMELNTECTVMHLIRMKTNDKKLAIVFDEVFATDDNLPDNHWDRIEMLRELGFSVPHHALIRNIEGGTIHDAFESFREYFGDIEKSTGIGYEYYGYKIVDNKCIERNGGYERFKYIFDNCDYMKVYEAKVKSVFTLNSGNVSIVIKVVSTQCNDALAITEINVTDISLLDGYKLSPGSTVKFFINNGVAYLTKLK